MLRTTCIYLFASLAHLESICASLILLLGIWRCRVSNSPVHIYLTSMESSPTLNEQHIWGGAQLSPLPGNTSDSREQQTTNIGHVHCTTCFSEPPKGGFVASYSDDLFHPTSQIPFSNTFTLPNVPFNPNPCYSLHNQCTLPPHLLHRISS